ncbi:NAD-dependent epimerase/dehydratase family protein [Leptospira idonii]|uniref:NAD-dependent epimerase/dehydratase family protein n=1 Tax=Leptospira idonii TaxID=1193500 RepID=UPI0014385460|nr:SDR family oxidoreductase [Leptospira idonii]
MKKVLITGGSGYLAGRIFNAMSSKYDSYLVTRNSSLSRFIPDEKLILSDWNDFRSIEDILPSVDVIIHTAGMNAKNSGEQPFNAYQINLMQTAKLVDLCVKYPKKKIIYFSTAHVYGSPLEGTVDESMLTANLHPYAASHKAAEDYILFHSHQNKLNAVIVRLSNTFGAPLLPETDCWALLVNDLCKQAVLSDKLVLRSDGMTERDFISMSEVLNAMEWVINDDSLTHLLCNLGGDWAVSVWELANLIKDLAEERLNKKLTLERLAPHPDAKISKLKYSIEKIKSLGYLPHKDKVPEIYELIDYCSQNFVKSS